MHRIDSGHTDGYSSPASGSFNHLSRASVVKNPFRKPTCKVRPTEPSPQGTSKKLEIVPGGLIEQPLLEDLGGIDWDSKPKTTFIVRVVNFEQFRCIMRLHRNIEMWPPEPPELPDPTNMTLHRGPNRGGMDSTLEGLVDHVQKHPNFPRENGGALGTPPRETRRPVGEPRDRFPPRGGGRTKVAEAGPSGVDEPPGAPVDGVRTAMRGLVKNVARETGKGFRDVGKAFGARATEARSLRQGRVSGTSQHV